MVMEMRYTERIRALREDSDLKQREIASLLHIEQSTYSSYERGKLRMPLECIIALAKYYHVSMDYICGVSKKKGEFPRK